MVLSPIKHSKRYYLLHRFCKASKNLAYVRQPVMEPSVHKFLHVSGSVWNCITLHCYLVTSIFCWFWLHCLRVSFSLPLTLNSCMVLKALQYAFAPPLNWLGQGKPASSQPPTPVLETGSPRMCFLIYLHTHTHTHIFIVIYCF